MPHGFIHTETSRSKHLFKNRDAVSSICIKWFWTPDPLPSNTPQWESTFSIDFMVLLSLYHHSLQNALPNPYPTLITAPNMLTRASQSSGADRWLLKLQLQAPNKPHYHELHGSLHPLSNQSRMNECVDSVASNVFIHKEIALLFRLCSSGKKLQNYRSKTTSRHPFSLQQTRFIKDILNHIFTRINWSLRCLESTSNSASQSFSCVPDAEITTTLSKPQSGEKDGFCQEQCWSC